MLTFANSRLHRSRTRISLGAVPLGAFLCSCHIKRMSTYIVAQAGSLFEVRVSDANDPGARYILEQFGRR